MCLGFSGYSLYVQDNRDREIPWDYVNQSMFHRTRSMSVGKNGGSGCLYHVTSDPTTIRTSPRRSVDFLEHKSFGVRKSSLDNRLDEFETGFLFVIEIIGLVVCLERDGIYHCDIYKLPKNIYW